MTTSFHFDDSAAPLHHSAVVTGRPDLFYVTKELGRVLPDDMLKASFASEKINGMCVVNRNQVMHYLLQKGHIFTKLSQAKFSGNVFELTVESISVEQIKYLIALGLKDFKILPDNDHRIKIIINLINL